MALLLGLLAGVAAARSDKLPPRIIFPVVGPVEYSDDFGEPRGQGPHEGIDILAPKRALAVAAEAGTVKLWTTSRAAGCMLYLYGDSGATYLYVHLNNDLTKANDNLGKCVAGIAYAEDLADGDRVEAGQPVGYVGDSGDANGIASHLHFEVHPNGAAAADPYPYLKRARKLLFAAPPGSTVALVLNGTAISVGTDSLKLRVDTLRAWPAHLFVRSPGVATIAVAEDTESPAGLGPGSALTVWTVPALATLQAMLGAPNALVALKIAAR